MVYTIEGFLEVNEGNTHDIGSVYCLSPGFCKMNEEKFAGIAFVISPLVIRYQAVRVKHMVNNPVINAGL